MRICVCALFAISLAGCNTLQPDGELSYALALPQMPEPSALSQVFSGTDLRDDAAASPAHEDGQLSYAAATAEKTRLGDPDGDTQPRARTDVDEKVQALQSPADAEPVPPSASTSERTFPRSFVPLTGYAPGTIVVKTNERRLYYVLKDGYALRYPVGVGKAGMRWSGKSYIDSKRIKPPWSPPQMMIDENPSLPDVIPSGSPANPMGDAALLIAGGEYAIHGTNRPKTIGHFVSHGCIRMYNEDVMDLFQRIQVGTPVVVER
jgi:lipoprotein-anchoring transpeptidase ErfK/SrfK